MRESCTSGSVRGARGNSRPYRNERPPLHLLHLLTAANGTERRSSLQPESEVLRTCHAQLGRAEDGAIDPQTDMRSSITPFR